MTRRAWVTRAEPGAAATARRVRSLGIEPVVQPLLRVRELAGADLGLGGIGALAFTSANAVRAFARRSPERGLPVFTVGDATAEAARGAGFAAIRSASGDVVALAAALAARRGEFAGVILNPTASEPAADLAELAMQAGLEVRRAALYETVGLEPPAGFLDGLAEVDHVLLHSPKAARMLARLLERHRAPHLVALALSPQVARPLAGGGLAAVVCAIEPNEASLLSLLERSPPV